MKCRPYLLGGKKEERLFTELKMIIFRKKKIKQLNPIAR